MNGVVVVDMTHRTCYTGPGKCADQREGGAESIMYGKGAMIIHTTEGFNSFEWLRCGNGVSIHKLITHAGKIIKMVPETMRAWHGGISSWGGRRDWGQFSIGYEIEHKKGTKPAITDLQYEAIAQSVAYDAARFHIYDYWIRYHREVAMPRGRKQDPTDFDGVRFWRRVMEIRRNWPREWGIPLWFSPNRDVAPVIG